MTIASKTGKNYVGVDYPKDKPEVIHKTQHNVFDLFSLKGKVASVTGSSSGIGYQVAEAFAQAGADIAIWYNSHDPADKVKYLESEFGVKVKAYKIPVTDAAAVAEGVKQQIADFGKIDVFVANAGIIWDGDGLIDHEDSIAKWDKVMKVNVDGVRNCALAIGPHFRERGTGSLVITGSMSADIINVPDTMSAYCVSKAAVTHLGKALALEWAGFARVNIVAPGYIATDMTTEKEKELAGNWGPLSPMGRMADPRELVGAYLYFASNASTFTTGAELVVDGGYTVM